MRSCKSGHRDIELSLEDKADMKRTGCCLARVKSKHQARVQTIRLGTHLEYVGSSPRVSGACQDGAREFIGRRSRLIRRLSGVAERLTRMGHRREFARRFAEAIEKPNGNMSGDYRKKTKRPITRILEFARIDR
ncbi:hypothetical protein B296_00053526, partial [Ensete ventricosum]